MEQYQHFKVLFPMKVLQAVRRKMRTIHVTPYNHILSALKFTMCDVIHIKDKLY